MDDRSRLFRSVEPHAQAHADPEAHSNPNNNHGNPTTHLTAKPHAFSGAILSPKHARELTPSSCLQIASSLAEQSQRRTVVPYTLWITEAWRVLGWAEPSAALFWEISTMYHTLYLAGRAFAADYDSNDGAGVGGIPPILSCGSASSVGSGQTAHTPVTFDKKKFSTAASAKELPVWLVGTFLLLHCEEFAFWRNLSGKDDRRFFDASHEGVEVRDSYASSMLLHSHHSGSSSLSPRTQLHAGWSTNHGHCAAYLLRHLRKVLLLAAVPHNTEAVNACMHLAALPSPPWMPTGQGLASREYNVDEIYRQHEEEHGQVGLTVQLSLEDLERLHLVFQPPQGGGIDDPPLRLGDFFWSLIKVHRSGPPPPMASLRLAEVERELRRHLELEIANLRKGDSSRTADEATNALAKLSLKKSPAPPTVDLRAKQPDNQYVKELSYTHLRGTTILLKPNPTETSSGASAASGEHHFVGNLMNSQRLHDLAISECSDAHFYLLQPFEHATISACTGCTIVVGAVAGLLHIVDCEKTTITSASRRLLVSNSCDVTVHIFSPSPPILVGDNRTCQFAPYNTYYDGLREDLLVTGLAAAVVSENHSPYHGRGNGDESTQSTAAAAWPPLQCASNKWKVPVEMSKLELPEGPSHASSAAGVPSPPSSPSATAAAPPTTGASSPGADDKAMKGAASGQGEATLHSAPVLVPPSEFHMLFVPVESETAKPRRVDDATEETKEPESQYCRMLSEVLNCSPFSLPVEYERSVLSKADRIRTIQQKVRDDLTPEQQHQFEEELNRGFREWLVTSGNLRQVLDLVHMEQRRG